MDSTALAFWKRPDLCLTIDYGQLPARAEIAASQAVCSATELKHEVLSLDCSLLGTGDLAGREALGIAPVREWWPFRNQLLVTLAASFLIGRGFDRLYIGCVQSDSVHRDGSADFVSRLSDLLHMQEGGMCLTAPAQGMSSVELIRVSGIPRDVLAWAHSCHVSEYACGFCRGCHKHFATTKELGTAPY
jgi:7-cyano-7-deazaguanine synthase